MLFRSETPVEPHAVGMEVQVDVAETMQRAAQRDDEVAQMARSGQERLPAVQDQTDLVQTVRPDMVGDALGCPRHGGGGHSRWPPTPTLVGVLVDIAVITCQVTPAMDLEHELSKQS